MRGSKMDQLPHLVELNDEEGCDTVEKLKNYIDFLYQIFLSHVVNGKLKFRGKRIRCQYRPETYGKHFGFWHLMQEGKIEDDRTIDLNRCKRIRWISYVIENAYTDKRIRVFPQDRNKNKSWVLWLHNEKYAVILWERRDYYLLKTAFMVKSHKEREFERDWNKYLCIKRQRPPY